MHRPGLSASMRSAEHRHRYHLAPRQRVALRHQRGRVRAGLVERRGERLVERLQVCREQIGQMLLTGIF